MRWLRRLILLVSFLVVMIFVLLLAVFNRELVTLRFLSWEVAGSLFIWLVSVFLLGAFVGMLGACLLRYKRE